ncbi:MAG: glycerophosphodiester phosphodiesterase [Lachnospiraceae bacterium]|nr:glycerophosphodiester phosphodiesterase [Lachnospiraceae bacterium]
MTEVWAHRGASGYEPENTLEAFELAARMSADAVELDVQMSRDGELVVIHDETTTRVSGVKLWVKDCSLQELKALNVNQTFPMHTPVHIPTLQEVYDLLKPTGLRVNVELKTGVVLYPQIEEAVLKAAKDMGMEERVIYSSFNHYTLRRIKELKPQAETGMLYADGIWQSAAYGVILGVDALHPALYNLQYPGFMEQAREKGLKVHVWTVNEEEHLRQMRKMNVDAVITNYPDRARKIVTAGA